MRNGANQTGRRAIAMGDHKIRKPIHTELFVDRSARFSNTVREQNDAIARRERNLDLLIRRALKQTQYDAADIQSLNRSIASNQQGRDVACVRISKFVLDRIEDSVKQRDEL